MKRMTLPLTAILMLAAPAGAELLSQRWGGKDVRCAHPGTLSVIHGSKMPRLLFDLSALPRGAKVHRARLQCFTQGGRQPTDSPMIHPVARLTAEGDPVVNRGSSLQLEAPWFASFDATEAVKLWAEVPGKNLGFAVVRFEGLIARDSYLDICYEGPAGAAPPQPRGLRAVHHDGQTFIVWEEAEAFRPKPEEIIWVKKFVERGDELAEGPGQGAYGMPNHPGITLATLRRLQGLGLRDQKSGIQGIKPLRRARQVPDLLYRVYRHSRPITPQNIHQAERLAEVPPLQGYDDEVYKIDFRGEYIDQREIPESVIMTYCIDKGKPLRPGETLYVHTARRDGKAFYAVTAVLEGTENLSDVGPGNSLPQPLEEKPAVPQPVLQWIQEDHYRKDPTEYWYRYWAAPPYCNLPSKSFRVAVAVANKFKGPDDVAADERSAMEALPLDIGSISGAFNVRGSLNLPRPDRITLLVQRQLAWLPALFYNAGRGTLRGMNDCKVDYFSERYMGFMIKWIMGKYRIDRSKISGSLMHFGLRHPEIFTRMSMGSYTAGYDLRWAPGGPSMPSVLGPRGIQTASGEDAWKMYSVGEYVNTHPDRDIPFLTCISGTGKDGGHTSEFGWQDDPRGWQGLLKARQPFVAAWSTGIPRELSGAFSQMRWDVSLPAFSNCSLDNNPGSGDPTDGDYYGQINCWLLWGDKDQADEKDRWEMTVWVISSCPRDGCTVDITPRHCKQFKPPPGQTYKWTNTSVKDNEVIQSGPVAADKWGLVTVKGVRVGKGQNRIVIRR